MTADLGELERLARAAQAVAQPDEDVWFMPEHFPHLEPEDAALIAAADPATILALISRIRAAEGALRPFAEAYDQFCPEGPDSHRIDTDDGITLGHLRAARAALPVGEGA